MSKKASASLPPVLPLEGLTVLEMGSSLAGPFAGRVFGDLGATVLKVETPEVGDASRTWGKDRLGGVEAEIEKQK